jgi:hypothetical protein
LSDDGTTIAIGVPGLSNAILPGSVRVYKIDTTNRTIVKIGNDINGKSLNDITGYSVALSADGQKFVVGVPLRNLDLPGYVSAYTLNSTLWQQIGSDIDGSNINGQDIGAFFGEGVAMSADGKTIAGLSTTSMGVFLFDSLSQKWILTGSLIKLNTSDVNSPTSIKMSSDGTTIVVGLPTTLTSTKGLVQVYSKNSSGNYQQVGKNFDGPNGDDYLGYSVASSANGKTIIIGTPGYDGVFNETGRVSVYSLNSTSLNWEQVGAHIYGKAKDELAGGSVAMSSDGKTIAVASVYNDGSTTHVARVYSFDPPSNNWTQVGLDLCGSGEMFLTIFDYHVVMSADGTIVAMSSPFDNNYGGRVRVFYIEREPTKSPTRAPMNGMLLILYVLC